MKAIDFAKILKEVIKREVRTVIREELKEALKPSKQPLRNTVHKAIPKKTPVMQKMTVDPSIPKTGNPGLDAILNETAVSMRNGQSAPIADSEDYPDMGSQFTADQAQGFGYMAQQQDSDDTQTIHVNPADPTSQFVKDYSSTLKAAEAINNGKHG